MTLSLDQANAIISGAFAKAAALGCKPLSVAVLDAAGVLLSFQRQAPAGLARPDIAIGKARAALAVGISSRKVGDMAAQRPHFIQGLMASYPGPFIPVAGGVLVRDGDAVVGAIGISGDTSDNDEEAAIAGVAAAGFSAEP